MGCYPLSFNANVSYHNLFKIASIFLFLDILLLKRYIFLGDILKNYTDLAVECYESAEKTLIDGVKVTQTHDVTEVTVLNENGARAIGKPIGRYLTYNAASIPDTPDLIEDGLNSLTSLLKSMLPDKMDSALVVGLGNTDITADALGPRVSSKIIATRHVKATNNELFRDFFSVASVATGVIGNTGIESAELVKGIVEQIKPSVVITVDALAASSADRLGTTVQLSDTGISPGSGVGNHRCEISRSTLNVPVIAIGIPTVVSTSVFGVGNTRDDMFVTPREIDKVIEHGSRLIGMAINSCLQPNISREDLYSLSGI